MVLGIIKATLHLLLVILFVIGILFLMAKFSYFGLGVMLLGALCGFCFIVWVIYQEYYAE